MRLTIYIHIGKMCYSHQYNQCTLYHNHQSIHQNILLCNHFHMHCHNCRNNLIGMFQNNDLHILYNHLHNLLYNYQHIQYYK